MRWGVVDDGFKVNVVFTGLLTCFVIRQPTGFLLGGLVHLTLRELCRIDPHFFRRWSLYLQTKARSLTKHVWGGSRLQPSHVRIRKAAEMPNSV